MSPPRTAVPTIRASVLLAAIGMAASPGVAASPADPAGWTFSGDVRGAYFASERTARDGAESDAEAFNARLRLAIERSLSERSTLRTRVARRVSSAQDGTAPYLRAYAPTRHGAPFCAVNPPDAAPAYPAPDNRPQP